MVGVVDPTTTDWSRAEFTVKGTGDLDRIEFREQAGDNDSYGGVIDNVSLVRAPVQEDDGAQSGGGNEQPVDEGNGGAEDPVEEQPVEEQPVDEGNGGAEDPVEEQPVDEQPVDEGNGGAEDPVEEQPVEEQPVDEGNGGAEDPVDPLPPVDEQPVDVLPERSISLKARNVEDALTGQEMDGTVGDDEMFGGAGDDHLRGGKGNDALNGDATGAFTVRLEIAASISDNSDPDAVTILIANVPKGATLSAGHDNGDGTWKLAGNELKGLEITAPDNSDFSLKVTAIAADGSGLSASEELRVTLGAGNADVIEGGRGADVINGNAGDDVIYGGSKPTGNAPPREPQPGDDDKITAGDGDDTVYAGSGNDTVSGDAGDDWISGGRGNDVIWGGDGHDVVYGNSGDDAIFGDAGDDEILGGSGNDALLGGDGNDVVRGGSGDDLFLTDAGDDEIFGGAGFDTLYLSSTAGDVEGSYVDLSAGFVKHGDWGYDTLSSIEAVIGGVGNDVLFGSTKDNVLDGGMGDDILRGGAGSDRLTGGEGRDTFVILGKDVTKLGGSSLGTDVITDLQVGDVVDVNDLVATRKADLYLKDDGQNSYLMAVVKGQAVEVAVLENFSGHTLDDMIKDGMLLV